MDSTPNQPQPSSSRRQATEKARQAAIAKREKEQQRWASSAVAKQLYAGRWNDGQEDGIDDGMDVAAGWKPAGPGNRQIGTHPGGNSRIRFKEPSGRTQNEQKTDRTMTRMIVTIGATINTRITQLIPSPIQKHSIVCAATGCSFSNSSLGQHIAKGSEIETNF
ncbi:hypothetical protein DdX_12610 [Ditylenchus destructor]|uniref:Uncharacterized protein n=1 Tax=Ditylenchus destructor TaxID=166010 RepID=A0AAD4R3L9_9BILA|nr:hypothetical protein DdX_12610 [Ditylenchus destructor]